MIIHPKDLAEEVLDGVLEAYVSRDGTDYGEVELSLAQKVSMLKPQVLKGEVLIIFDSVSEEINLVTKEEYEKQLC